VRVCSAFTEAAGAVTAKRLLASGKDFTAVLAGNDLIAFGVLAVLADAGIRCPADVSVIGFNDLPLVDKLTPPLTTVRLPSRDMGALAARTLLADLDGDGPDGRVAQALLGVELAIRGTTAAP
jgi:LacI family transcriptional regulator